MALGNLFGRNRAYIDERLPHVAQLLADDWEDVCRGTDVIIVGKNLPGLERLPQLVSEDQTVIDLVGIDISGLSYGPGRPPGPCRRTPRDDGERAPPSSHRPRVGTSPNGQRTHGG